jgi:hypothetical protein
MCIAIGLQDAAFATPEEAKQTLVTVTTVRESCDYFIVETDGGCCIFEWFGGNAPVEGDILRGYLDSYGFQNAYNVTQKTDITAYVEEYWLDREEAIEKLSGTCGVSPRGSSVD